MYLYVDVAVCGGFDGKGRDDGICDEITLNKLPEATFTLGWNNNNVP